MFHPPVMAGVAAMNSIPIQSRMSGKGDTPDKARGRIGRPADSRLAPSLRRGYHAFVPPAEAPTMPSPSRFVATALLLFAATLAPAQTLSPEEAVKRMKVADGFEVKIVAAEPLVRQPVSISFDDRG